MISVLTLVLGVSIAVSPDERRHRLRRGAASILNVCYLFGRPRPQLDQAPSSGSPWRKRLAGGLRQMPPRLPAKCDIVNRLAACRTDTDGADADVSRDRAAFKG